MHIITFRSKFKNQMFIFLYYQATMYSSRQVMILFILIISLNNNPPITIIVKYWSAYLILLSNGIFSMYSSSIYISFLDSLERIKNADWAKF